MNSFNRALHYSRLAPSSFLLVTCLTIVSLGFAEDAVQPSGDPSDVQERAVIRDPRATQGTFTPAEKPLPPKVMTPIPITPQPTQSGPTGPLPVVGGIPEPDYRFPWVVRMNGCSGVLIDPQWVLTAAHCVTPGIGFGQFIYRRTDPYTGVQKTETRGPSQSVGPSNNRGVFIHPEYAPSSDHANDIALIKLAQPFTINPYIQTVGLPRFSRSPGVVGTVANFDHNTQLPPGQVAVFRAPIPAPVDYPPKFYITAMAANASLCKGDSGSGFVTVESGRAMVRGVASQGSINDCKTPAGEAVFTDVFNFRNWILQTMGKNDATLAGNTRVRWSGRVARGVLGVGCINPYETMWGPLNVVGVEVGAVCEAGQTQTIMCNLEKDQGNVGVMTPTLAGLYMRTTMASGATDTKTIAPSSTGNTASFFGPLPAGASREFICQIATPLTSGTIGGVGGTAVLSRGVSSELDGEASIEQPSPFDPSEEMRP